MAGSKKTTDSLPEPSPGQFELQFLKGIGPKRATALDAAGIRTQTDLIHFFPRKYLDRSNVIKLSEIQTDQYVTVIGKIESTGTSRGRRRFFYLVISDGSGILQAVWFNQADMYRRMFTEGEWISLSGKVGFYRGYQIVHPDFDQLGEGDIAQMIHTGRILPVYPGRELLRKGGINTYSLRRVFHENSTVLFDALKELFPEKMIRKYHFIQRKTAFLNAHLPDSNDILQQSMFRLIYEELFFPQLMLALQRHHMKNEETGISFEKSSAKLKHVFNKLPFELTEAQKQVMREIRADMKSHHPMNRLLQGDVGSGKTIIALMAMLIAVDNGYQTALMVPTEILAEQHYRKISAYLDRMDVSVFLLTGNRSQEDRKRIAMELSQNKSLILIGTHALIQERVDFSKLGFVVIDEQHRFGVMQRSLLKEKGISADVLVMTATPIPRTLALTLYGSLDVSHLDELPPDRQKIKTVWRKDKNSDDIYTFIQKQVAAGEQVFIVFPLVEESEKLDLKAATESYQYLKSHVFQQNRVALIHGRMRAEEKETVMSDFVEGKTQILVSTTVIEVGVDIPNATVMLIEHAERFGLSQLHQLRGRVGRGAAQSYCILKTPNKIGEIAERRMRIMEKTNDGFKIAEEDLNIRGWGDFFGVQQSGFPGFKLANPITDIEIMKQARQDAFAIVARDPHLRLEEHSGLRKHFTDYYADCFDLVKIG
jgi:ATP-dependent DNA helicase RecG